MSSQSEDSYSVVGFLETVWFLETPIRKLLQILLNPVVIIFRSIYSCVSYSGPKSSQSQNYFNCRNFEKVQFWPILAECENICSEDHWITSYFCFLYMTGYLSFLPTSSAFEKRYFLKICACCEVLGKHDTCSQVMRCAWL